MWLGAAQAARRLHRPHQLSRLAWDKSRLSKQVGRMAARGLVERKGFATDARGAVAALTKTGRDAIARASPVQSAGVRKWFISALVPE
jgi:DNA-binding MarR family transcriptional regulator